MSKATIAAIVGGLFLVTLIGFNVLVEDGSSDNPVTTSIRDGETTTATKAETEASAEATESTETAEPETATEASPAAQGVYTSYSQAEIDAAAARDDRIVLVFSADWCPTCQNLKRNLNSGIIPDGLTLLELDYDTETDLKQKHGVRFQHTLVEVDANGDSVKLWAGSRDVEEIVQEL